MPCVGGSMVSLSLDGRQFSVVAGVDVISKVGGSENELHLGPGGTCEIIKTIALWQMTGFVIAVDLTSGDDHFLQCLQDRDCFFKVDAVYASGSVRSGIGQITGKTLISSMHATATVDLMGPGQLTPKDSGEYNGKRSS